MFGNKWRVQKASYWDAMAERCAGAKIDELIAAEVRKRESIIEIGCGGGHAAALLRAAGFSGSYWGCDISRAAIRAARARLGSSAVLAIGQFEELSAAGSVPNAGLVVARGVVQHQKHWLPLAEAALRHAPVVLFGIIRSIYFKQTGEHETQKRGSFYDVCISLEAMESEARVAGLSCSFTNADGPLGPEVVISLSR